MPSDQRFSFGKWFQNRYRRKVSKSTEFSNEGYNEGINYAINLEFQRKSFYELSHLELYEILALRQMVFIVEQNCPYLDADGKDAIAFHLYANDSEGHVIAYCRLLPQNASYEGYVSIGRVVTSIKVRGQNFGRLLMEKAISTAKELYGNVPIKISAQYHLEKFYTSLGFRSVGDVYLEDDIDHIAMIFHWSE